ncbi:FemAB family XrtA/PEP-CTERM system-associated protein [Poriferisphaera sp. WC338]|uniref:FemAB family XrtA/PEP-CTERM system-associated protein n=1 Tax=Poriferisphaera sp. WC338 TaxID=3425129 RepID=UPI003D81349C
MIQRFEHHDSAAIVEVQQYLHKINAGVESDPRWLNILHDALGHRTFAYIHRDPDTRIINGYLPLSLISSPLFGRFLVSLPYINRAGIHAHSPAIKQTLLQHACQTTELTRAQYLELRHESNHGIDDSSLTEQRTEKVIMELALEADEDARWKQIGGKTRNLIRKGEKNNLSITWGHRNLLDDFYQIFAINMRDLGTPVYPKKLFQRILAEFDAEAELCTVQHNNKAVAGALLLHDNHTRKTSIPSASCLREANKLSANMWMYHQMIERTAHRGNTIFDFGRTTIDSGTYRFKKQWGAKPTPCTWQYHVLRGSIGNMRPDDEKMQKRIEMWKKMPLWVTKMFGPTIVKGIP